jgi:glycosyltransferase involved in cell wall biosynthesis
VLHVIPTTVARGAQREARALADRLDRPGERSHRVLSLFDAPADVDADLSLGHPGGRMPAAGFDPRLVARLRSALTSVDPTLVVAHGGDPLKYLVPAMAPKRRPLVYYAIGTYSGAARPGMLRRVQLEMWKRLLARADVVAAEGEEVRDECTAVLGVPQERVVLTPNGRDPHVYRPAAKRAASGPPVVSFVGALAQSKRPQRFVEVVGALRATGAELEARLAGDGPLHDSLAAPAASAGVELLGTCSDVPGLLRDTDLLLFTSDGRGEGMPGVLIEAGLSGVPVVATLAPGVATVVRDGETGLIVDDSIESMAAAAGRLLGDQALRSRMGAAARRRCLRCFSLDAVAARWLALIEPLVRAATRAT